METRTHRGGALAAALTAIIFGLVACGAREAEVESEPGEAGATAEWRANIQATGTGPGHTGSATASTLAAGGTRVTLNLTGGSGGGTHPWHIHTGTCGSGGDIVGNPSAYPVLRPDPAGNATATAQVDVALDPGGSYHINIHQSPERTREIVACGELRPR